MFSWSTLWARLAGIGLGSAHNGEPNQDDELPIIRGDAPPGMFTPRWEELHRTYGIERPRGELPEIVIHRMPREDGIFHLPTWDRHVVTPDLWPEELIDDITRLV